MKRIAHAVLACCLVLFTACPALAKLEVTFINRTDFELQFISITEDSGSTGFSARVVPGNFCVFTSGNSSELHEAKIDTGLMLFTFTDMNAALAGNSSPTLELTYDADDRPHLTLVDKKPEQADSGSAPDSGSAGKGASFDLPAGPIWNNDHARERCPEVLKEWLAANPGKQAVWSGSWATVEAGESVCGITLKEGEAPSSGTGAENASPAGKGAETHYPSLINFVGKVTVFADPLVPAKTEFSAVIKAATMGDIKAMGAQPAPQWSSRVYLPVAFAGKTWAAFVEPAEAFAEGDAVKPGACTLYTYTLGTDNLPPLMQKLAEAGYRPWFAQHTAGEDMDTVSMVKFWTEYPDAAAAWKQVTDACADINREGKPAAVDTLLLTEQGYARAAKGENAEVPGFRMRVSNSHVITLQYMPDISMLIGMTRD